MITVHGLAKQFARRGGPPVPALRGLDFDAPDGRITALLGPNGAGKTTTLRILSTLLAPDGGSAQIDGLDCARDALAVRARIGVLAGARGLYARLTARENVHYYARLQRVPAALAQARLDELAALLDMRALLDRRTAGFSTGEALKVALARALIHDPQHLLLDEPTNGLDVASVRALRQMLLAQRARGKCIVLSSHVMQEVEQLADGIAIVSGGVCVAHGDADALRRLAGCERLEDAFVALSAGAGA